MDTAQGLSLLPPSLSLLNQIPSGDLKERRKERQKQDTQTSSYTVVMGIKAIMNVDYTLKKLQVAIDVGLLTMS